MEHFFNTIQGWFTFEKLYTEIVKTIPTNSNIVEVGSWKGRSSVFMGVEILNSGKKIKFDCVDTWKGSEEHISKSSNFYEPLLETEDGLFNVFLDNILPLNHIINPIRLNSVDASKLYDNESLDFVFIDASHDYIDVKNDILSWLPKIKKGGILAGHDYNHPPVNKAVDELLNNVESRPDELVWYYENSLHQ